MEVISIKNLTFSYPKKEVPAIREMNLCVNQGDFLLIIGKSGSGKTTLLNQLKPITAAHGTKTGEILYRGQNIEKLGHKEQASQIGYVMQNPDSQIVTDRVWHELAFGLENLGVEQSIIRIRVAEMASYFGIEGWFHKDTSELSGGQKQLLTLAGIMAMQPDVIIFDEPTAQLDPIAAGDLLATISKINKDLGITIIITEQRLEEAFPYAGRIVVVDKGELIADCNPKNIAYALKNDRDMMKFLPTPMRVYSEFSEGKETPININEGRLWLNEFMHNTKITKIIEDVNVNSEAIIELKDVYFRYNKNDHDILRGLSLSVFKEQINCILGGNGAGKTTLLNLIAKHIKPISGKIILDKINIKKYSDSDFYGTKLGLLPQDPQSLFVAETVKLELLDMIDENKESEKLAKIIELFMLSDLLENHPYDLSGGEQQRLAFAKIMLLDPEIILLDEPTKGLDNDFKEVLGGILLNLKQKGKTILMVSHDVEFCAQFADVCSFIFNGENVSTTDPRKFFSGNSFYTTSGNKMSRGVFENAVTAEDIIYLCKQNLIEK